MLLFFVKKLCYYRLFVAKFQLGLKLKQFLVVSRTHHYAENLTPAKRRQRGRRSSRT